MELYSFLGVLLCCALHCSCETSSPPDTTFLTDLASNTQKTPIALTSFVESLEPSVSQIESTNIYSVDYPSDINNNSRLTKSNDQSTSSTIFPKPTSGSLLQSFSTAGHSAPRPSGDLVQTSSITVSTSDELFETTMTEGGSSAFTTNETPIRPSSTSFVIRDSLQAQSWDPVPTYSTNIFSSSSMVADELVEQALIYSSTFTTKETPPMPSATSYLLDDSSQSSPHSKSIHSLSSIVSEDNKSSKRTERNFETTTHDSGSSVVFPTSSQVVYSQDNLTEVSTILNTNQDVEMCSDPTCLHSMQSPTNVVSSSEHDVSFSTLITLHASGTDTLVSSSGHLLDITLSHSELQHEDISINSAATALIASSLENSAYSSEYDTSIIKHSIVDSFIITHTSTIQECCSSMFTDSASVIPATITEQSLTTSTVNNIGTTTTIGTTNTTMSHTTAQNVGSSNTITATSELSELSPSPEVTTQMVTEQDQNTTTEITTIVHRTTTQIRTTTETAQSTTKGTTASGTSVITSTTLAQMTINATIESDITVTTEKTLNTSDALSDYWVVTALIVPTDENIDDYEFRNDMEFKLATLYDEGYKRDESAQRKKRAVSVNNVTIQITNVTRDLKDSQVTSIVYYMETYGNTTEAQVLVDLMEYFRIQEVALILGREIVLKAKLYTIPPPPPEEPDRKLWIIGVVFGALIVIIGCCWCILFIYFKCTRPTTTKRSPRTPRSFRAEVYSNEGGSLTKAGFKPNEVKGFDVVRTEVGLENEIYQNDRRSTEVKEPYRKRDGSTELEGMYSADDQTPERTVVPSVSPPLKNKRLKQISMESENDTEERQTDMSEDRLPLSPPKLRKPKKGKKKHNRSHRGKGKKQSDGKDAPKPKMRSSVHPAARTSYGNDEDDDEEEIQSPVLVIPPGTLQEDMEEVRRSLKAKTEIERQNNKRRQRSLKSEDLVKDTSDPVEMKRLQRELDSILDPSSAHSSLGSPNHENDDEPKEPKHEPMYLENFVLKKRPDSNLWSAYNATDEAANITKQAQNVPAERLKHLSQISFDSDDNDSVGSGRRSRVRSAEYPSPRPSNLLFGAHRLSKGKKPFNLPKDEYTSIRMSSNAIAPESKRNKRDSEQSDSGRYSSDDNLESSNGQGSSLHEAYLISEGRTTSLKDGYLVQHVHQTPKLFKSSSVDNPRPTVQNTSAIKCSIPKPSERINSSDDDVDVAEMVMKESAPPIMIASIRQEMQRQAQKSPRGDTSITKF